MSPPWEHGTSHRTLPAVRDHLIGAGICRKPNVAGTAPPMHLEPSGGVPAAGEGTGAAVGPTLVFGLFMTSMLGPSAWADGYSDRQIVDVWIRALPGDSWRGPAAASAIAKQFAPAPYAARHDWQMADASVIESRIWRPFQPIGSGPQGWTWTFGLYLETYRA